MFCFMKSFELSLGTFVVHIEYLMKAKTKSILLIASNNSSLLSKISQPFAANSLLVFKNKKFAKDVLYDVRFIITHYDF
jgi:hypothetical protein